MQTIAPLALNECMRNAQAGTFLRVLGVGSDEGRMNDDKTVTGAGFVVGDKVSHNSSNELQKNPYAYLDDQQLEQATKAGRTHLLGCFMRDVTGSTFLQDAGVQTSTASGVAQIRFSALPSNGDFITLKFIDPTNSSQSFTETFEFTGGGAASIAGAIAVNQGANEDATVSALQTAIRDNDNGYGIEPNIF